jgi:tetratricopeptide (TPR) repeat protein
MLSGSVSWASWSKLQLAALAGLLAVVAACHRFDARTQAEDHLRRGQELLEQRELASAMAQFKQAENLLPQVSDDRLAAQVYEHIAWLNANGGAHDLAIIYYDFARPHAERSDDKGLLIDVLIGKAHAQNELGEAEHAWQTNREAERLAAHANRSQLSSIAKNDAYHQLLHDSIDAAERSAERALQLADDTASLGNAFALLSYIYGQQGKTDRLESLLKRFNDSPNEQVSYHRLRLQYEYYERRGDYRQALEAYRMMQMVGSLLEGSREQVGLMRVQEQYDREMSNREKAEQRLWYTLAIIVLLNMVLLVWWWFGRKQRRQYQKYRQDVARIRDEMGEKLRKIAAADQVGDKAVAALPIDEHLFDSSVADTKAGVDVLYDLVAGNNVSQFGKKEEREVERVLWLVNKPLAQLLDNCPETLTPKETFFCIMEYYGKDDRQKAASFCCSEQAVRSTKSRLGKKLDIGRLRNEDNQPKT